MKVVFFALFAAALAPNVFAQEENQEKKIVAGASTPAFVGAIASVGTNAFGSGGVAPVKNAPFSAEMVSECTQTLADGNHISQQATVMIYRDKEGRIRRESSLKVRDRNSGEYKEYKTIQIADYFGGQNFTLDPQNHTATKLVSIPAPRDAPGVIKGSTLNNNTGAPTPQRVSAAGPAGFAPSIGFAPIVCGPGAVRPTLLPGARSESKNESLGSQVIEGMAADGVLITHTIPAGSMGNERPIEITYERWYSNELQLDVLIKSVDPRSGESTQRMTNINLVEPDASLFEIPPDYTVRSSNSAMTTTLVTPAGPQATTLRMVDRPGEMILGTAASSDNQLAPQPMSASLKPTILYRERAQYTEEARQKGVEGTVVLSVVFNANGSINEISVIRGLPYGLTEKAIEGAKKIRFQPAVLNGQPVSVRGSLEFTFSLHN
ncbi:MAG: energy transducer TonB [Chloracidobacterium sp.]|nr:energy transducer TonB [Chloracidobacterium sp.]